MRLLILNGASREDQRIHGFAVREQRALETRDMGLAAQGARSRYDDATRREAVRTLSRSASVVGESAGLDRGTVFHAIARMHGYRSTDG